MRILTPLLLLTQLGCVGCDGGVADTDATVVGLDPSVFTDGAVVGDVTEEPCTLASGTQSTCYRVTVAGEPASHAIGPFCPRNISENADNAGIWIEDGQTWDLSGTFIADLATFYNDDAWQLYDEVSGDIYVTDTKESCEAAARPDVDPQYQNHCVECALEDIGGAQTHTFLLPVTPIKRTVASEIDRRGKVGVSLSGVVFDPPAPTADILRAHTIAAFDDCGGHVNPHTGYHYHAATGCAEGPAEADGHAALVGFALDGFGMYAMRDAAGEEATDLDACRGHEDAQRGYHYHVASAGENLFIGCLMGDAGPVAQ